MSLKKNSKVEGLQEARPRTKADVKGKIRRSTAKAQESVDKKIDEFRKKAKERAKTGKKSKAEKVSHHMQCHAIQAVMQSKPLSVEQIAAETGLSIARVQGHVNWEVKLGRATVNSKGKVIINPDKQPRYRKEA